MSADTLVASDARGAAPAAPSRGGRWRTRRWQIAGALSVTETVSWGILYYTFAVFLVPMQRDLGFSAAQLTGAFSLSILVSGAVGIAVGRHLDRRSPRGLMTVGSAAGALLVTAWASADSLAGLYAIWIGLGVVMAAVLYEPAFTVLAKHFHDSSERRRAMTAMTLVAALASFIFMPLAQALIDAHGWRDALLILAALLAVTTVPLHALVLGPAPPAEPAEASHVPSVTAARALRSAPFWELSVAFFLASITAIAVTVHAIPLLLERGHSPAFAAFAVGTIGIAQVPGRLLFAPVAARMSRPCAAATVFSLIAVGIVAVALLADSRAVLAGLLILGMGNGMATLARATAIADLYGNAAYGSIASVAASLTTAARAFGPVAAALLVSASGYSALLWLLASLALLAAMLAHRAERSADDARLTGRLDVAVR